MDHRKSQAPFIESGQAAFTIIELLVSVAILGIIAVIIYFASNSLFLSVGGMQEKTDLERMRFKYRMMFSCSVSIPASSCGAAGSVMTIRDMNGGTIVKNDETTKESSYLVRAVCLSGRAIQFEYKSSKDPSGPWLQLYQGPIVCPRLPT